MIGSGIAGAGAADALTHSKYNVTVFEAQDRFGGNAQTVFVDMKAKGGKGEPSPN